MTTYTDELPWYAWAIVAAIAVGFIVRLVWAWRHGYFRREASDASAPAPAKDAASYPSVWDEVTAQQLLRVGRPANVPVPNSVDEVAAWAGSSGFRRTELIYAPIFWVVLPLAAFALLIQQTIVDPTGSAVGITIGGEVVDSWPTWLLWIFWGGASVWLIGAVFVLVVRLSVYRNLVAENPWIFAHGVAYSIHRSSVDYDGGETGGWATYIALDWRLDDQQAACIHAAFEKWLRTSGLPPSGSGPISSESLFGAPAKGGYFFLHLPVSQTAGDDVKNEWVLITEPRKAGDDVIVTPVPAPKQLRRMRAKAERRTR